MQNLNFYKDLPSFLQFLEVFQDHYYQPVPSDWYVIITDVQGSTKAIEQGRYRSVNIVGAASIVSVINAVAPLEVPYVFGGDGATVLVPASVLPTVAQVLSDWKTKARMDFKLELRVGAVPVAKLYEANAFLSVAKYQVSGTASTGNFLAMFKGKGFQLAEQWIKQDKTYDVEKYQIEHKNPQPLNLQGLSCRWNPVASKKGQILSIIIKWNEHQQRAMGSATDYQHLKFILDTIFHIVEGDFNNARPTLLTEKDLSWFSFKSLRNDYRIQKNVVAVQQQLLKPLAALWESLFRQFITRLMIAFKIKVPAFDAVKYVENSGRNADFKKFDEMLRFVLDCSPAQADAIEAFLQTEWKAGRIFYGIHKSTHAVMTCLVRDLKNSQHVHFIDGDQGGYALAAKQLKKQIKDFETNQIS